MKKYSKCAIYKLEKIDFNESYFYKATLVENTYNPKLPTINKWEFTFYNCQIYTTLPLETANFDLGVSKNKLSFDNISNPAHSVIRVLDWEYVNRTQWKGNTQVKTEFGKPIYKQYIAINECEFDSPAFKTDDRKLKDAQQKIERLEKRIENMKEHYNKQIEAEKARSLARIEDMKHEISKRGDRIRDLKDSVQKRDENALKQNEVLNKRMEEIQINYNPNYKPKKKESKLPTLDDMLSFDDI